MTRQRVGLAGPTSDDQGLSERLKEVREYLGLKQEEVSRHLNVPRSAISEIENGKRAISALELKKLARLYQRPVSWFTGEADEQVPADVAFLARTASELSNNDRQELQRFADFLRSKAKVSDNDAE